MAEPMTLFPCPFCGDIPTPDDIVTDGTVIKRRGNVDCCISGPEVRIDWQSDDPDAWKAAVVAAWNTRSDATITALQSELRDARSLADLSGDMIRSSQIEIDALRAELRDVRERLARAGEFAEELSSAKSYVKRLTGIRVRAILDQP